MDKKLKFKILIENFLSILRVHNRAGGIEISDQVIRFSYFNGKSWQLKALKMEPGIIVDGVIKDKTAFYSVLMELKYEFFDGKSKKKKVNVVVSISSANIYSQVFSLPILQNDNLEKAVGLNIQMISPMDFSNTYADWQTLSHNETTGQSEFLSVFIDKKIVDEMATALLEAGFIVMAIDSKALVLARLMREKENEIDISKTYIIVNIDNIGIDFIVIKNGKLYFEYMNQWSEIGDDKGKISIDTFSAAITRGIRQVVNFYTQHWNGTVDGIFIVSNVLYKEAKEAILESVSVPVLEYSINFNGQDIGPEWFIALGCGMRSFYFEKNKQEISLLNVKAEDVFSRNQIVSFIDFWRVIIPTVLFFSVIILASVDIFISNMTQQQDANFKLSQNRNSKQVQDALATVKTFNKSVTLINYVETSSKQEISILSDIYNLAINNNISVTSISFDSSNNSLSFNGSAISQDNIFSFQKALQGDSKFSNVDVPLSNIQKQIGGTLYAFTLTLSVVK